MFLVTIFALYIFAIGLEIPEVYYEQTETVIAKP